MVQVPDDCDLDNNLVIMRGKRNGQTVNTGYGKMIGSDDSPDTEDEKEKIQFTFLFCATDAIN